MDKTHALLVVLGIVLALEMAGLIYFGLFGYKTCESDQCLAQALRNNCQNAVQRTNENGDNERLLVNNGTYCLYTESRGSQPVYSASLVLPLEECAYWPGGGYGKIVGYKSADGSCNVRVVSASGG